ncbi:Bromodomain-containing protein [Massariosphaeria phaeospora]|uniref:Bromodomain-containing protein n=1 Tax=Massariosphaeria phaeospora TaxID=100035 RepID=A0A7C8I2Q9_9PLEO|nr:Bromodomain-containing protein [Massariosphaeria phaeospora]
MNTSLTAYTHLESLLLFQSLHTYGVGNAIFSNISELLKSNAHITSDKRFQSGRLSPDALRNFYLHILNEEATSEQGVPDGDAQNGEVRNSRKRKALSPSLPSVQESLQHQHLIPRLVNKLYARYRAAITDQIRHDEDKYDRLQREYQGIERGEWDDQLRDRANGKSSVSRSPSLSKKSPVLHQKAVPPAASPLLGVQDGVRCEPSSVSAHVPDGSQHHVVEPPIPPQPPNGQIQPDPSPKDVPNASARKKEPATEPLTTPSASLPLPGPTNPPQQTLLPHPLAPSPAFQRPQPVATGYIVSPQAHRSPYAPQAIPAPPNVPPPSNLHAQNQAPVANAPPPTAPPSVGQLQPHPIQPYGANGVPHYGPVPGPPQFSSTPSQFPGPHPPPAQSPAIHTPQQQRNPFSYPVQPPYPPQQAQIVPPPPQGGFMLPPFQVSPQDPSRAHHQPPPQPHYPQVSTPITARQGAPPVKSSVLAPPSANRAGLPPMHPLVTQARHSFSTPTSARSPQSALMTPRSAKTIWKSSARVFATPPVPRPQVSPIDDISSREEPKKSPPKAKPPRKPRGRGKAKDKEKQPEKDSEADSKPDPSQTEEPVPQTEPRRGRLRRKAPVKRKRLGSIASSQAAGSTRERSRSHSILSHTETIAADTESQTGNRVKSERGTSVDVIEEDPADGPTPISTRRRAGKIQPLQSKKRKRNARDASPEGSDEQPSTPGLAKVVIAPRHFSRMCNPIMNDISSHKHASTFTTAVKPKDAEGYYEIIKRPTDLKSIQKAVGVGSRLVTAMASDTPAASPGGAGGIVELPMTVDNIPPKAIVNSAQLEKELMRMFANAVMFNAGEEGVVEDAREMFEAVQRSVASWRNVERASGRLEVEDTPVPEEDVVPTASKRRKL